MRHLLIITYFALVFSNASATANEPAKKLLAQASELASIHEKDDSHWSERLLEQIIKLQVQIEDTKGAHATVMASTRLYNRPKALVMLANELAAIGRQEESLEILKEVEINDKSRKYYLNGFVRGRLIENLLNANDLEAAEKVVKEINSPYGYRKLAITYAQACDNKKSAQHFQNSLDVAMNSFSSNHVSSLWQTASAQISVGHLDAAKKTNQQLIELIKDISNHETKLRAICYAAELSAKLSRKDEADDLFQQAFEFWRAHFPQTRSTPENRGKYLNSNKPIVISLARAGYLDKALTTLANSSVEGSEYSRTLLTITMIQLWNGDIEGAIQTAFTRMGRGHSRDMILHLAVDHYIQTNEFDKALSAANKFHAPTRKAPALLKIATAYAKANDPTTAKKLASSISLKRELYPGLDGAESYIFDCQKPLTWGVNYNQANFATSSSHYYSIDLTAELATHAMALAQVLSLDSEVDCSASIQHTRYPEVARALARTYTATGNKTETLNWVNNFSKTAKTTEENKKSSEKHKHVFNRRSIQNIAAEKRVNILIGLAEGFIDRENNHFHTPNPDENYTRDIIRRWR